MRKVLLYLCLVITWAMSMRSATGGDQPLSQKESVERTVKAVVDATGPFVAAEQYRVLFSGMKAPSIDELTLSSYDSLAIQAAWQLVNLTLPEKNPEDGNPIVFRPDGDKLNWFLGFFQGRGHMRVPKWWKQSLLDARANTRSDIWFPDRGDGVGGTGPAPAKVTANPAQSLITVGTDSAVLPADLVKEHPSGLPARFSAVFTPKMCYVAIYDDAVYPYAVVCVDRQTARVIWRARGWGSWWYQIGGSVGNARVTLEIQDDRVVVFGVSGLGLIHAEAFRADNGKNIFRFSNTYCEHN
jgi:hypothetical protein